MFTTSQTSSSEAKGLVDGQTFGCRPGGPESADGWEIAAKAFGPEARPGNDAGPPTRQAFVATLQSKAMAVTPRDREKCI